MAVFTSGSPDECQSAIVDRAPLLAGARRLEFDIASPALHLLVHAGDNGANFLAGPRRALEDETLSGVDVARRARDDAPQVGAHHHHQGDACPFGRAARAVGGPVAEDSPPTLGQLGPEGLRALAEHFPGLEIVECDHRAHASISASGSCTPSTSRKPIRTARPIATAGESPPF